MKKLTNEQFKQCIYKLVGNEYTFLDKYVDTDTKIRCQHNKCGKVWPIKPSNFYHGNRCPRCSHKRAGLQKQKDTEWFKQKVYDLVGGEYTVASEYIKSSQKVNIIHNKCGYKDWWVTPNNFLKGRRCPKCKWIKASQNWSKVHKNLYLSKEKLDKDLKYIESKNISVVGNFTGVNHKIEVECNVCGKHWNPRFSDLTSDMSSCPVCTKESKGEYFVRSYLELNKIEYEMQKTFDDLMDKQHLSYDFYIPDKNILIEYQGGQHYFAVDYLGGKQRFKQQKKHDLMKYNYAKEHNYKLIYIPYICDTYKKVANYLDLYKLNQNS